MTNYLTGNLKFQIVDKNLPYSNNNYFNFSISPHKPTIDPFEMENYKLEKLKLLDSLQRESNKMLGSLDAELSKMDRKKERLMTFRKFGIDPNYKVDTNIRIDGPTLLTDSSDLDSKYEKLLETKTGILKNLEKISDLKRSLETLENSKILMPTDNLKKLRLEKFGVGRMNSRPDGASISVPMDGIGFELNNDRWIFRNETGVTRENNAQFQNPIEKILLLSRQPFNQYFLEGKRFIQNNEIRYKLKSKSEVYYKFGYTSKSLSKKEIPMVDEFSSLVNAIGGTFISKRIKNFKVGVEMGKVETGDSLLFQRYLKRKTNLYQKGFLEYHVSKSNTTLKYTIENFEKDAYQIGFTQVRKDYRTHGVELRQQLTSKCSLILKEQQTQFQSAEISSIQTIEQRTLELMIHPIKGLIVTSGIISSDLKFRGLGENRKNLMVHFSSHYQWSFNNDKYQIGLDLNEGTTYTFINSVYANSLTIYAGIKKEKFTFRNTFAQANVRMDEEVIQDSKINSLEYILEMKEGAVLTLRWDLSILQSGFDNGGKLDYQFPLGEKVFGTVSATKYVKGSIPSIFQPNRFEKIPMELSIKLSMKL